MQQSEIISQPQLVKRFYFIDYFFILLESCERYADKEKIFSRFKELKIINQLGESKYRRLTQDDEDSLSQNQLRRFKYSYEQVIIESVNYGLLKDNKVTILLTELGRECLSIGRVSKREFNIRIFKLMEDKHFAFYQLIHHCFNVNRANNGTLIFPIYSPLKLGFVKSQFKKVNHVVDYVEKLSRTLMKDVEKFLDKKIKLKESETVLLNQLVNEGLISTNKNDIFNADHFYKITQRIRSFWLNFFLKSIYHYAYSFDAFNIWVERGKQIGIMNSTEFYPDFDGRLVYPTSIIINHSSSNNFEEIYHYDTGSKLYIHLPAWDKIDSQMRRGNQDDFIQILVESYFDLRKLRGTNFVRLLDLREKVCYRMRIPVYHFDECLEKTYLMSLKGEMDAQISLEADRLPHETSAMYLKREPVLVNGKFKNIIAIDYKKNKQ